jgi:hypothetical protein
MNTKSRNTWLIKIFAIICVILLIGLMVVAYSQIVLWISKRQAVTFVDLLQDICIWVFMVGIIFSLIYHTMSWRYIEATDVELIEHRFLLTDIVIHWHNVVEVMVTPTEIKIISDDKRHRKKIYINHCLYDEKQRKETIGFIRDHLPPDALYNEMSTVA